MHRKITEEELILGEDGIKRLPELDGGITSLDLSNCYNLTSLPENLPAGLTSLNLYGFNSLTSLPENLPAGLTSLDLSGCTSLESSLPENLPASLTSLNLYGCASLTSLPENLPAGLTWLDLVCCNNLRFTPELIERLQALEERGAEINYPTNFNQNDQVAAAKEQLESAITAYKTNNPDPSVPSPEAIKTLLGRFLSEGIGQRGGPQAANAKECLREIVATTSPVLDLFTQTPNHLKWADEIAKGFLAGCVNQPVAGWSEISAWTSIAQAPTVADKIAATKHLRVLEGITDYIATLPQDQKPGAAIEAEAGNALFREAHKKLLNEGDIAEPWLGVPKSIAYEGMIRSWLTEERIATACNQAKTILATPQEEVARYLLEGRHRETWAEVAFPEEIAAIKNLYANKAEFLDDAIAARSGSGDLEFASDEKTLEFAAEYFNPDGSFKQSKEELEASQAALPNERDLAISGKIVELTNAALMPNAVAANLQESQVAAVAVNADEIEIGFIENNQQPSNTSEARPAERPSAEVVDVTSCSPLTQMLQRVRDFFSRS